MGSFTQIDQNDPEPLILVVNIKIPLSNLI